MAVPEILKMQLLCWRYGIRCRTQSTNRSVLVLYQYLLKNEKADTDFWWMGIGQRELLSLINSQFTEAGWRALEQDLPFWTNTQLSLFLLSIMYDEPEDARKERHLRQRVYTILSILRIGVERDESGSNILDTAREELRFLDRYFDDLLASGRTMFPVIAKIIHLLGDSYVRAQYLVLWNKLQEAENGGSFRIK